MKDILSIFIVLFLLSCGSQKKLIQSTESSISKVDSTSHEKEITTKDSIIYIKGDSIPYSVPCDNDTSFIINSTDKTVHALITVKNGEIQGIIYSDDKVIVVPKVQEKTKEYEYHKTDTVYKESEIREIPVKYIPKLTLWFSYIGMGLTGFVVIYLILKLKKLI